MSIKIGVIIFMTTESELRYLYGLSRFGIKPGLATMERIMEALDHPERKFQSVHVTGTNGKGSTCAMIESVLRTAGYATALYTSPHLYAFNERITVGGQPISDELLIGYVAEIRAVCKKRNIQPTFFEFTTALAFLHFARSNIDVAIIEVGMGGRHDATNVIIPLVSVITNVGLDHMEFLGFTKAEIAKEKAGTMKEGVPVITAEEDEEIVGIFYAEAKEKNTSVIRAQEVVGVDVVSSGLDGQEVAVTTYLQSLPSMHIHLPLLGFHQVKNLATALAALNVLSEQGWNIAKQSFVDGIAHVHWEGRLQVVSRDPLIIVDGAHNADGVRALHDFLRAEKLEKRGGVLVFAMKKGKDVSGMLELIVPFFHTVIATEGAYMPESANILAEKVSASARRVIAKRDGKQAIELGISHMKEHDMMLIAGSLYMIPEALSYFRKGYLGVRYGFNQRYANRDSNK